MVVLVFVSHVQREFPRVKPLREDELCGALYFKHLVTLVPFLGQQKELSRFGTVLQRFWTRAMRHPSCVVSSVQLSQAFLAEHVCLMDFIR